MPLPTMQVTGSNRSGEQTKIVSTRLLLSGHDFLMASAAVRDCEESLTERGTNVEGSAEKVCGARIDATVCFDTPRTVLVPETLYSPEMNRGYMAVNDFTLGDDECVVAAVQDGVVALMAVDKQICTLLSNLEAEKWCVHYTSPLLEGVVNYTRAVRITLTAENSYVTISDHGKLQYAEAFATTEPDNLLFVMSRLRELLSLKGYEVRVSGPSADAVAGRLSELWVDCKAL